MSGTRIGEVLLASTYASATHFCLLQVTVQSLESASKISLREVISSVDTCFTPIMIQNRETSDPMIIIVERVMRALRHEKISRVPRKDETKVVSTMGGLGRRAAKNFESHRRRC